MARNTEGADEANAIRDALSRGELDPHNDAAAPAFIEFIERYRSYKYISTRTSYLPTQAHSRSTTN